MRNLKLTVAYDGTAYHGFQRQANAITVQQILEEGLTALFGHEITVTGSARTDTGVHAYGQVVNFYTTGRIPAERIVMAARGIFPADIVVREAVEVAESFHARISAKSKVYLYRIYNARVGDPFCRNYAWHIMQPLNVEAMTKGVAFLKGTHDFSSFRASGGASVNPVRTIMKAAIRQNAETIECEFWGTGFLYHMVRNMVGTLVEVGMGKRPSEDVGIILAGRDRTKAGVTAPPEGLFLSEVIY